MKYFLKKLSQETLLKHHANFQIGSTQMLVICYVHTYLNAPVVTTKDNLKHVTQIYVTQNSFNFDSAQQLNHKTRQVKVKSNQVNGQIG